MNLRVRSIRDSDMGYLVECWVRAVAASRTGSADGYVADVGCWAGFAKPEIRQRLRSDDVRVAVVDDDDDAILGFAVVDRDGYTRFCYTRSSARGLGVQAALFAVREAT